MYGYEYKKPHRPKGYIPPQLSEKDEYIPTTHVGMYSILRNPKNKSVFLGEDQCQNVRRKTFNNVLDIFRKYGSPSYVDLWNYNISAINNCGLNYFITNPKLAPVGTLIECFEKIIETKKGRAKLQGNKVCYISFGINKSLLLQYFKNVDEATRTGTKVKIPRLNPPTPKSRELVLFGEETFSIKKGNVVTIDRNAIYNRFIHWCKLQSIPEKDGLMMALETLFKCYPIEGLEETHYYNVVTELDRLAFQSQVQSGEEELTVRLSKIIYGKAQEIIARYNLDANNISKGPMTPDVYINNAIHLLNSNMPIKYQDPDFVKEQKETEQMEDGI